ncbi:hypothetical protein C8J57DRAFT_1716320 [Mycena rebaudengoi]|nr:hypothetical protein C8J57DRAFT_1716320 [Mycena rebaudengoi]
MALAGEVVGTFLYGIYFVLFIASIYLLLRHNGRSSSKFSSTSWSIMFFSSCALFLVVTAHFIITFYRSFLGFIYFHDGPVVFFKDNTQPVTTAVNITLGLAFVLGDGMIIYRMWIVWSRNNLIVILPVLSEIALAICHTFLIIIRSRQAGKELSATKLVTPTTCITMGINIYCTVFIAYKIWRTTRAAVPVNQTNLMDILIIVVESAALYTTMMVIYETTYQLNSQIQYAESQLIVPIVGIANALIQCFSPLRAQAQGGEPASPLSMNNLQNFKRQGHSVEAYHSAITIDDIKSYLTDSRIRLEMAPPSCLAGIMAGTVLYGIYLVLFIASIYPLLGRHNGGTTSKYNPRSWSIILYCRYYERMDLTTST